MSIADIPPFFTPFYSDVFNRRDYAAEQKAEMEEAQRQWESLRDPPREIPRQQQQFVPEPWIGHDDTFVIPIRESEIDDAAIEVKAFPQEQRYDEARKRAHVLVDKHGCGDSYRVTLLIFCRATYGLKDTG